MNEREKFDPAELADIEETLPWNASLAGVVTYIYLTQIPEVIGEVIDNAVNRGELDWKGIGAISVASLFLYGSLDVVRVNIANKNDLRQMRAEEAYLISL